MRCCVSVCVLERCVSCLVDIPVGGAGHEMVQVVGVVLVDPADVGDVNMKADICNMIADRITILIFAL